MWFAFILIILAVLFAALTIVSAGAFTIVLVVAAVIAAVAAGFMLLFTRAAGVKAVTRTDAGASETVSRVGGETEAGPGRVPATPEELVDARRAAQ